MLFKKISSLFLCVSATIHQNNNCFYKFYNLREIKIFEKMGRDAFRFWNRCGGYFHRQNSKSQIQIYCQVDVVNIAYAVAKDYQISTVNNGTEPELF